MTIMWVLPVEAREELLQWCSMPLELYQSLAIVHQMAVVEEWHKEVSNE